jgi:ABC-type phosphate/phosphonate transport system substrate-binding protein
MTDRIAALPMYDWPEVRAETNAQWTRIREILRTAGIDAPETLTRETGDVYEFWRPMGDGLADHVHVIGQPDYSDVEGGEGELYRSVVLMRADETLSLVTTPFATDHQLDRQSLATLIRDKRFAYNVPDSMSGYLALQDDLGSLELFREHIPTGGHRASIRAVAAGRADVCAIDCRSWALAQRHEPAAAALVPVGWTTKRKGLPYITSRNTPPETVAVMRAALMDAGLIVA